MLLAPSSVSSPPTASLARPTVQSRLGVSRPLRRSLLPAPGTPPPSPACHRGEMTPSIPVLPKPARPRSRTTRYLLILVSSAQTSAPWPHGQLLHRSKRGTLRNHTSRTPSPLSDRPSVLACSSSPPPERPCLLVQPTAPERPCLLVQPTARAPLPARPAHRRLSALACSSSPCITAVCLSALARWVQPTTRVA
jgi:hypothetical protein